MCRFSPFSPSEREYKSRPASTKKQLNPPADSTHLQKGKNDGKAGKIVDLPGLNNNGRIVLGIRRFGANDIFVDSPDFFAVSIA